MILPPCATVTANLMYGELSGLRDVRPRGTCIKTPSLQLPWAIIVNYATGGTEWVNASPDHAG